ncbi:hypothetical protein M569_00096 [Genlisea aurea]|uniref:Uncharacterized protein n=1 Tax=Genlisea aurea TaxID=192259 RepID=S8D5G2_9LAMI|nr:hypothetical protein M569_00096 [Genlisea aurea]
MPKLTMKLQDRRGASTCDGSRNSDEFIFTSNHDDSTLSATLRRSDRRQFHHASILQSGRHAPPKNSYNYNVIEVVLRKVPALVYLPAGTLEQTPSFWALKTNFRFI